MKKTKEEIIEEFIERQLLILDKLEYKTYSDLRPFIQLTIESAFNFSQKLYANQYKELEAENFKLSAMACIKPTSDDYGNRTCDDKNQCTMIERVRQLESDQEKQGWVKCSDRMPEFDTPVLVFCKIYGRSIYTYVFIGEFLGDKFGNWHDGKSLGVFPPTHWMPLPQKPNDTLQKTPDKV